MVACVPSSSAKVDFVVSNNATFVDALQFDPPVAGVTGPSWSLSGQNFRMDIRANMETAALTSFTSAAGQIVVDDATQRIIHFNVSEDDIAAPLIPGTYLYDLIMFDNTVPKPIRVQLAHGRFIVTDGVTGG